MLHSLDLTLSFLVMYDYFPLPTHCELYSNLSWSRKSAAKTETHPEIEPPQLLIPLRELRIHNFLGVVHFVSLEH